MKDLYKKLRDEFFVEMLKRKSGKIKEKRMKKNKQKIKNKLQKGEYYDI